MHASRTASVPRRSVHIAERERRSRRLGEGADAVCVFGHPRTNQTAVRRKSRSPADRPPSRARGTTRQSVGSHIARQARAGVHVPARQGLQARRLEERPGGCGSALGGGGGGVRSVRPAATLPQAPGRTWQPRASLDPNTRCRPPSCDRISLRRCEHRGHAARPSRRTLPSP